MLPLSTPLLNNAPFFRAIFSVLGDIERICSVFSADFKPIFYSQVGGLDRSEWVDMLRFRHRKTFSRFVKANWFSQLQKRRGFPLSRLNCILIERLRMQFTYLCDYFAF